MPHLNDLLKEAQGYASEYKRERDEARAQRDALGKALRTARDRCARPHTFGLGVTRQDADQLEREYQRDLAVIDKALADLGEGGET